MASLVEEIGSILTASGIASTGATGVNWKLRYREFVSGTNVNTTEPNQIAIVPTGGFTGEPTEFLDRPSFQVLVRADGTSTELEQKCESVKMALNLYPFSTGYVLGRRYVDIQQQGDLLYLGRDENRRPTYSLNFLALRSRGNVTVTSIVTTQSNIAGGAFVFVNGTGFGHQTILNPTLTIKFGGALATNIITNSDTQVSCFAPAHAAGTVSITVERLGWDEPATLPNAFTYVP